MGQTKELSNISKSALKLIELLQLGKLDKGAVSTSGSIKYNSLHGHWFSAKKKNTDKVDGDESGGSSSRLHVHRESIITLNAENQDKVVSVQYFCVNGIYKNTRTSGT